MWDRTVHAYILTIIVLIMLATNVQNEKEPQLCKICQKPECCNNYHWKVMTCISISYLLLLISRSISWRSSVILKRFLNLAYLQTYTMPLLCTADRSSNSFCTKSDCSLAGAGLENVHEASLEASSLFTNKNCFIKSPSSSY